MPKDFKLRNRKKSTYLYLETALPQQLPLWHHQSHEMLFWFQKVQAQLVMNISSPGKYIHKNGKLKTKQNKKKQLK